MNQDNINFLIELFSSDDVKQEFQQLTGKTFLLARDQEKFIIDNSNGRFIRIKRSSAYGDFKDTDDNYYNLIVGKNDRNDAGAINYIDILTFGTSENAENHYFICTNQTLSKLYIINAKELYEIVDTTFNLSQGDKGKEHVKELEYSKRYASYI